MPALRRVLIANRGEIVARIARSCHAAGLGTVAVYSDADEGAPFVESCERAVRIGGHTSAESYLDIEKIIGAARLSGADAIHPGFGFLAENPALPRACAEVGITFVGPSAEVIEELGSKRAAKALAVAAGVPVIPGGGTDQSDAALARAADEVGFPVLVKASAGGGGKGMRVVQSREGLAEAIASARREAQSAFGDPTLLIERYIERPRHIEIQILADDHGTVVHLGERECSIQRRHQKIIEEAPSPAVDADLRQRMGQAAVDLARQVGYRSAGTVEFIVDEGGAFYFLEVNTRLQVEHPVTEMVTGIDIVAEQLRVAEGRPLSITETPAMNGHAIQLRLYAEDPDRDYLPQSGAIWAWDAPRGEGVRVDHALAADMEVPPYYDPMLAKVIAWGRDRDEARRRVRRAIGALTCAGIVTNQPLLGRILDHPAFAAGALSTHFLGDHRGDLFDAEVAADELELAAMAATLTAIADRAAKVTLLPQLPPGFSNSALSESRDRYRVQGRDIEVVYRFRNDGSLLIGVDQAERQARGLRLQDGWLSVELDRQRLRLHVHQAGDRFDIGLGDTHLSLERYPRFPATETQTPPGGLTAPMPATVAAVAVTVGERIEVGQTLLTLEAMKMEHTVRADRPGTVDSLLVATGDTVATDQLLVIITPEP